MNRNWDEYDKVESAAFESLKGKTLKVIDGAKIGSEKINFECIDGERFQLTYYDDCCATCSVEDICGDIETLIGHEILLAECVESSEPDEIEQAKRDKRKADYVPAYEGDEYYDYTESETWAFYKLSTIKGSVTLRWYGSSNGYYSETATFERLK